MNLVPPFLDLCFVEDTVVARCFFAELPGVTDTALAGLGCGVEAALNIFGRAGFR